MKVVDTEQTPRAVAEAEVRKEREAEAVKLIKEKLKARAAAQTIVDNLERELADLEEEINQGNF